MLNIKKLNKPYKVIIKKSYFLFYFNIYENIYQS